MNKETGIKRLISACRYSMAGFQRCWLDEAAFRQEIYLSLILVPLAFWLGDDMLTRLLLIMPLVFILIAELLNSAIEACIDLSSPEIHPLAKKAKDIGSAAVALALIWLVIVWLMVLI